MSKSVSNLYSRGLCRLFCIIHSSPTVQPASCPLPHPRTPSQRDRSQESMSGSSCLVSPYGKVGQGGGIRLYWPQNISRCFCPQMAKKEPEWPQRKRRKGASGLGKKSLDHPEQLAREGLITQGSGARGPATNMFLEMTSTARIYSSKRKWLERLRIWGSG